MSNIFRDLLVHHGNHQVYSSRIFGRSYTVLSTFYYACVHAQVFIVTDKKNNITETIARLGMYIMIVMHPFI